MTTSDVLVIGAGLHGCSAALHLARRGLRVRVIDKDHVGRHASGVNAGGVRRLGRHLGGEGSVLSRALEAVLPRRRPADGVSVNVGDGHYDVVEGNGRVGLRSIDIFVSTDL